MGKCHIPAAAAACLVFVMLAPPSLAQPRHEGVATCASSTCHGRAKPVEEGGIQRNEYVTWASFDPHARAYATLLSERSRAMATRLGLPNAHEAAECLDCHTDNVPAAARGGRFQLDDGIGCEACHGGAEHWLASHYDVPRVTRADNIARGLRDLNDPAVRAELCLGCHVGDGDRRFASHRIMAAGHPRLGFELDTFTEIWRTSGGREHYRRERSAERGIAPGGAPTGDDLAVGAPVGAPRGAIPSPPTAIPGPVSVWTTGLVAHARQYVGLVGARYPAQGPLPDFALFNCYSCHRAMGLANWQEKGTPGSAGPGALRFDDSTLRLLEAALVTRPSLARELRERTVAFQRAVGQGPRAVTAATSSLEQTLATIGAGLARSPLDRAEASQVLAELGRRAARGEFPDYVHAEQAAMGLTVLQAATGEGRSADVEAVFRVLEDDERYDPARFRQALRGL